MRTHRLTWLFVLCTSIARAQTPGPPPPSPSATGAAPNAPNAPNMPPPSASGLAPYPAQPAPAPGSPAQGYPPPQAYPPAGYAPPGYAPAPYPYPPGYGPPPGYYPPPPAPHGPPPNGVPVELRSRGSHVGYELYLRKHTRKEDAPVVQCAGDCTALVAPGDYVLLVSPGEGTRIGRRAVTIGGPSRLEIEPASASSRWAGLALATISIPVTLGGIGLAGGAAFGDVPNRRGLFWAGSGITMVGVGAMFAGWALYAGKPRVDTFQNAGHSTANVTEARYDAPPPMMQDEHSPKDAEAPTVPYRTENRPGQGLIVTGAVLLGASYGTMLLVAAADVAANEDPQYEALAVPIAGPLLLKNRGDEGAFAFYGTAPELAGLTLLLIGLGASHDVWVRDWRQPGVSLVPVITQRTAALGVEGSW